MKRVAIFAAALLTACAPKTQADTATPADTAAPEPEPAAEPVAPIPAEFGTLTPQIAVADVAATMEFYVKAFGGKEVMRMPGPDGSLMHGEVMVGNSMIMIDKTNEGVKSPPEVGGTNVTLHMFVANADEVFKAAIDAGAKELMPLEDMFWGDRYGEIEDPAGHRWAIATHIEDLTGEQMQQRSQLMMEEMAKAAKSKKKPKKAKEPAWKSVAGTPTETPVPEEYRTVTMMLTVHDAAAAIDFYTKVLGGTERMRMPMPDGKLMHAEVEFDGSVIMLSDEVSPERKSAKTLGGSPMMIHHYTPDAQAAYDKATAAGAHSILAVQDMFWGDRYGAIVGPDGMAWGIATHVEDVSEEEMAKRMQEATSGAEPADATNPEGEAAAAGPDAGKPEAAAAK